MNTNNSNSENADKLHASSTQKRFNFKELIEKCVSNANERNEIYTKLNEVLEEQRSSLFYSENQYDKDIHGLKESYYGSHFDNSQCFETSRSAKLYDTLYSEFGMQKDKDLILNIIFMVECSSDKLK